MIPSKQLLHNKVANLALMDIYAKALQPKPYFRHFVAIYNTEAQSYRTYRLHYLDEWKIVIIHNSRRLSSEQARPYHK